MNRFVTNGEFRELLRDWMVNAAPDVAKQIMRSKHPWGWPCGFHGTQVRHLKREHVYLARSSDGPFKIGISYHPHVRIPELNAKAKIRSREESLKRPCGPVSLVIEIGWCQLFHERALHNLFEDEAIGGEWFDGRKVNGLAFIAELFLLRREAKKAVATVPNVPSRGALEFAAASVSGAL